MEFQHRVCLLSVYSCKSKIQDLWRCKGLPDSQHWLKVLLPSKVVKHPRSAQATPSALGTPSASGTTSASDKSSASDTSSAIDTPSATDSSSVSNTHQVLQTPKCYRHTKCFRYTKCLQAYQVLQAQQVLQKQVLQLTSSKSRQWAQWSLSTSQNKCRRSSSMLQRPTPTAVADRLRLWPFSMAMRLKTCLLRMEYSSQFNKEMLAMSLTKVGVGHGFDPNLYRNKHFFKKIVMYILHSNIPGPLTWHTPDEIVIFFYRVWQWKSLWDPNFDCVNSRFQYLLDKKSWPWKEDKIFLFSLIPQKTYLSRATLTWFQFLARNWPKSLVCSALGRVAEKTAKARGKFKRGFGHNFATFKATDDLNHSKWRERLALLVYNMSFLWIVRQFSASFYFHFLYPIFFLPST